MRIKGLETENLYFDFRHKDEGDTVKIHCHFKSKVKGKKALGEKVGGLIASKDLIQDIHVRKKYIQYFDEIYRHEKQIIRYSKKYIKEAKKYKPDNSSINGFKSYTNKTMPHKKAKKVYIEFLHPNGNDSIALKFYTRKKDEFIDIGFANVSPNGIKELHLNPEYGIYFKYIYEKRNDLTKYAKKCALKNSKFLKEIKADVNPLPKPKDYNNIPNITESIEDSEKCF